MLLEYSLELNIKPKQMKPASQKYLCPDIKYGICYFFIKFGVLCPYSHSLKEMYIAN